ncbi:MAG: oligosaccharide flippase family protein [Pseudomonadota bacterium]
MKRNVMSRTATASIALVVAQLFAKLVDFFLILLLARILTPEDFALIAIAMIFVQVTEAVLEMPVFQAIIRVDRVTRNMLHTAFTISIIRSIIVVAIILVLTPVAVFLFDDARLYSLMALLSLAPALRGLYNPKMVLFARRLNFYPEATISVIAKVVTALIALPFAITTKSYWALAMMTILAPTILFSASYIYVPFRPKLSLKSWNIFSNMVGWSTVAQFFNAANWQSDVFVLGQFVSRRTTGNLSVAHNLNTTISHIFIGPVIRPFISSFSELMRTDEIKRGYLSATKAVFLVTGPVFATLAILSVPSIYFLFGPDWTQAPQFMTVIAFATLITVSVQPAGSIAYAMDRTVFVALIMFTGFLFKGTLMYVGYQLYGIPGFFAGQISGAVAYLIVAVFVVKHLIKIPVLRQISNVLTIVVALGAMAFCLRMLLPIISYDNQFTLLFSIIGVTLIGLVVYLATICACWIALGRPDGIERDAMKRLSSLIRRSSASA